MAFRTRKCNLPREEFKLHTQWKDLGLIDRLVPLIYLKSDRDQSVLNKRIGRVQWDFQFITSFT